MLKKIYCQQNFILCLKGTRQATSISVDMDRVKTSVPSGDMDGGDSQRDGHSHYAQALIYVQSKTMTQCMGSGTEILKGNLTLEFLILDFFFSF